MGDGHNGGGRPRITDSDLAEILRLAREGVSRNAIAKQVKRSPDTVSRVCKDHGVSFDRAAPAAAIAARLIDLKAKRQALQIKLLDKADKLLDEIDEPHVYFNFGGKDNTYEEHEQPCPSPGDKRYLMQAATAAIKSQLDIDARDGDNGAEGAKSMIGAIAAGLEAAARELEAAQS